MREKQKKEALRRLEQMDLHKNVVKEFERSGTIYYSERTPLGGILYWLSNNPEWVNLVKQVEDERGILVYHATHEYTSFGECLSLLYVSGHEEEWEMEREEMQKVNGVRYFCSCVINLTDLECSGFGTVGMKEVAGGLIRVV